MSRSSSRRSSSCRSTSRSRDVAQLVGASRQLGTSQLELRAQPGPAQDRTCLPGQPLEQAFLDRRERAVLVLLDDQYAEDLAAVPHLARPPAGHLVLDRVSRVSRGALAGGLGWPGRCQSRPVADDEPDLRPLGAGALGQHPGHPRRQLLGGVAARHRLGEAAQHVVRRGDTAVHRPGRERLQPGLDGFERQRDDGRRQHREGHARRRGVTDQHATAEHDHDVHQHDEHRQTGKHEADDRPLATRSSPQPS